MSLGSLGRFWFYLSKFSKLSKLSMKPILEMRSIVKEFPGVKALDGVTFDLYEGEFHSLVGENGAGKSTLMKVLSGVYPFGTYGGDIVIDGEVRQFKTIRDSENAGVPIIF